MHNLMSDMMFFYTTNKIEWQTPMVLGRMVENEMGRVLQEVQSKGIRALYVLLRMAFGITGIFWEPVGSSLSCAPWGSGLGSVDRCSCTDLGLNLLCSREISLASSNFNILHPG